MKNFSLILWLSLAVSVWPCPTGWRDAASVGLGCLLFNADTGMDWNAASEFCKGSEEGASLVEILTSEQMDFMMMELGTLEHTVRVLLGTVDEN